MTKQITKDEKGELLRLRQAIEDEIQEARAKLHMSMEQVRRAHYRRLGELFIQLRMTFPKGEKGDREFVTYCRDRFPGIKDAQRDEYITYRKRLKGGQTSRAVHLPPLRKVTFPHQAQSHIKNERAKSQYSRIVDEEIGEVKPFDRGKLPERAENELVYELAEKILITGFKVLAVKLHPDKDGGSNEAMRRLNKARKLLESALIRLAPIQLMDETT
jgi:hypothetical protein